MEGGGQEGQTEGNKKDQIEQHERKEIGESAKDPLL